MSQSNLCFFKYTVTRYDDLSENQNKLETVTGITCAADFCDACFKITEYFGDATIENLSIVFIEDCAVMTEEDIFKHFRREI
jgi:hypothetical protein